MTLEQFPRFNIMRLVGVPEVEDEYTKAATLAINELTSSNVLGETFLLIYSPPASCLR
jgi:hypothetical protein